MAKDKKKVKASKAEDVQVKKIKKVAKPEKADKKAAKADKKAKPAKAGKAKRKALPTWKAPDDFKPHFLEVVLRTDKDGLFSHQIKATRFKGRYDPNADDKKKTDLAGYDPKTLMGVLARFSGVTYKPNNERKYPADIKERNSTEKVKNKNTGETDTKMKYRQAMRLPANTVFKVLLRVIQKKNDNNALSVAIKFIQQAVKSDKTGRVQGVELDKKDPAFRLIRKAKNFLPPAFSEVLMPPKRTRGQKVEAGDDE